jgi:DNA-binding CsgD family transcriptional regulator
MSEVLSAGELARLAAIELDDSPHPALVLEVPSERIVAASPSAVRLLDPDGGIVTGHLLEEFTSDRPLHGFGLFAGGRINGFETSRVLRRADGPDVKVRMWIRLFDGQPSSEYVVAVLIADPPTGDDVSQSGWQDASAVVGSANAALVIERISSDAEGLFNVAVSDLLGTSLLSLVTQDDVPALLLAFSEASAAQNGITVHVRVRSGSQAPALSCDVIILPLQPAPSCAFVFLPIPEGQSADPVSDALSAILLRLGRGATAAQLARGIVRVLSERKVPGVERLTTRELEIVTRLLQGDRAPAIAVQLFVSQSTVRNHLASVFAKLGVASQQQLLDLFRPV